MKIIYEELLWYCLGNKNPNHKRKHNQLKEYKNITNLKNFLSTLMSNDEYYVNKFNKLLDNNRR